MLEENETPELETILTEAVRAGMMDLRVAMPCRVHKYNKDRQEVDLQPLIKKQYRLNDEIVSLPIIPSVPVHFQSSDGGNVFISLPLKADIPERFDPVTGDRILGDLGFCIVCDRSINTWLSGTGQEVVPGDVRIHNLTDAIFIPGLRPFQNALENVHADNLVIQNTDLRIELSPTGKMKAASQTDELLLIISDLITQLINALVITGIGPQPFVSSTVTSITAIKTRLDAMRLI